MKKTLIYKLNGNYRGVAEIDNSQVLIYIEANKKVLFNLITVWNRICKPTLFELGTKDSEHAGCTLNGVFLGRVMSLTINERDITTFNLMNEVNKKFLEVLADVERKDLFKKHLSRLG